mmetsp:Transcript_2402/g.5320  ORF Transcript_2402/g.5320 Transcript_2402/m.5320 type:complete len:218 (+) Transcript_2402:66-719(+)
MTHATANRSMSGVGSDSNLQKEMAARRVPCHTQSHRRGASNLGRSLLVIVLACAAVCAEASPLKQTSDALASGVHSRNKSPSIPAGVVPHHDLSATAAAQYHVAHHKKQLAMKRLGMKASASATSETFQTQAHATSSTDKSNKDTASILPFLLPPIGLVILATITGLVVSIRRWQKIPSLPTQGRLDIKDVQASAARAGGMRTPPGGAREMAHPWGN